MSYKCNDCGTIFTNTRVITDDVNDEEYYTCKCGSDDYEEVVGVESKTLNQPNYG